MLANAGGQLWRWRDHGNSNLYKTQSRLEAGVSLSKAEVSISDIWMLGCSLCFWMDQEVFDTLRDFKCLWTEEWPCGPARGRWMFWLYESYNYWSFTSAYRARQVRLSKGPQLLSILDFFSQSLSSTLYWVLLRCFGILITMESGLSTCYNWGSHAGSPQPGRQIPLLLKPSLI